MTEKKSSGVCKIASGGIEGRIGRPLTEVERKVMDALMLQVNRGMTPSAAYDVVGVSRYQVKVACDRLPDLASLAAHARQSTADRWVEETVDIADSEDDAQRARNRIQARQWAAARYRPEVYGDRVNLQVETKLSISDALADAMTRAKLLPPLIDDADFDAEIIETPLHNQDDL